MFRFALIVGLLPLLCSCKGGYEADCNDGVDNDGDGLVDCDDADCTAESTCLGDGTDSVDTGEGLDADGDGYLSDVWGGSDCDDSNPEINPGATEICNELDDDCDGLVDDEDPDLEGGQTWFFDNDSDGYGRSEESILRCVAPDGYSDVGGDCDDYDVLVNPGVFEICGDGVDADCDGGDDDCRISGDMALELSDSVMLGEAVSDMAGSFVAGVGDMNGDGFDDMLAGAPGQDSSGQQAGAAYLLLGPATTSADLSTAHARLLGQAAGDEAGISLDGAGDVGGDGFLDLVLGASGESTTGEQSGAAYLVAGPVTGELGLASADARLLGEEPGDHLGISVAGAGDVNGDGRADLLLGANQNSSGGHYSGVAYLVLGPVEGDRELSRADASFAGENSEDHAGISVAGAGDLNGDGFADLLVGARGESANGSGAGAAYLVLGPVEGQVDLSDAHAKMMGEHPGDGAGQSVAGAGDVNGDGLADLLIGAPRGQSNGIDAGVAYLVMGPVTGEWNLSMADTKFAGEASGDSAGYSVAGAGDVNGDGHGDLLVGATDESSGSPSAGVVYLVLGSVLGQVDLSDADARMYGESAYQYAGCSVAGAGDVDNDGYDDIMIGANSQEPATGEAGTVYLLLGGL